MQDRFKFRTYIPDLKFFKYWGWTEDNHYVGLCACGDYQMPELLEKYTMQCTGLKDKNGRLIYEGDIVEVTVFDKEGQDYQYICQTFFGCYGAAFDEINKTEDKTQYFSMWQNDFTNEDLKVIGNIYENQELLEVQNA